LAGISGVAAGRQFRTAASLLHGKRLLKKALVAVISRDMKRVTDAQREQAHREYLESKALSAQPTELVHMLYQLAIDNLNAAIACLDTGDAFARARAVTKAEEAVHELVVSLDRSVDAPFTRTLADLYNYVLNCTVKGHAEKSKHAFQDALSVLTTLAGAWTQIKDEFADRLQYVSVLEERESPASSQTDSPYCSYSPSSSTLGSSRDWTG
jgi:flagellar biosynthetic protein FliS